MRNIHDISEVFGTPQTTGDTKRIRV